MADPRRPRLIGYLNQLDVTGPAAVADDLLAHLDLVDPLRALLADEGQALEVTAKVRYEAVTGLPGSWDEAPDWSKAKWIAETTARLGPVRAALREVAGL